MQHVGARAGIGIRFDPVQIPPDRPFDLVHADHSVVVVVDEVQKLPVGVHRVQVDAVQRPVRFIQFQGVTQILQIGDV